MASTPLSQIHILFVHKNFPAQFGETAAVMAMQDRYRCSFISEIKPLGLPGLEMIQYQLQLLSGPSADLYNAPFRAFTARNQAVYSALAQRPDFRPDVIVGHSDLGGTLYLQELYNCPVINYFEWFHDVDADHYNFRPDFPKSIEDRLAARMHNANFLLDLNNCDAGLCPTQWQKQQFPTEYQKKLQVIFDGVNTALWKPIENPSRRFGNVDIPSDIHVITYVSRGMESIRGFDLFLQFADRMTSLRKDVVFLVVGEDRVCYGADQRTTNGKPFKQWLLERGAYDLSRTVFLGRLAPPDLARLFSISDLHVYLTAPFVLSWSMMDAMACKCLVMGSNTPPVKEMIEHERNGLLVDFFDVDQMVETTTRVLRAKSEFAPLRDSAMEAIHTAYSLEYCVPKKIQLIEKCLN